MNLRRLPGLVVLWIMVGAGVVGQSAVVQGSITITVCDSGCDFTSIQAAIDHAISEIRTGRVTIDVRAGEYPEDLHITESDLSSLTITGEGQDQVVVRGSVLIQDASRVTLKSLT